MVEIEIGVPNVWIAASANGRPSSPKSKPGSDNETLPVRASVATGQRGLHPGGMLGRHLEDAQAVFDEPQEAWPIDREGNVRRR